MTIAANIMGIIGNTPLVRLDRIAKLHGIEDVTILGKCEFLNPSGSVKDRAALSMIETAERNGKLSDETVIIEPTSGNTGIALALICAVKGYRLILTMPESMSLERRKLLAAYGAEIELTPAHLGMEGAINKAEDLALDHEDAFIPQQFNNRANPLMHQMTTAEEIWSDTDGNVDLFVSTVGTGGTFTGVSCTLKEKNSAIKTIAVEPKDSAVISGKDAGPHMIQGIGAGFVPDNLDKGLIDEIITVSNEDSFELARQLAKKEGVLVGMSSGANLWAALELAKRPENKGKTIVTILCDFGERYLSTTLYEEKEQ